jgi:sporulation protein YlmC with PRC-barrel domain
MITHQNIAAWRGKDLVDQDGDKIGKLEDVYVDFETDEPVFGTVKEGLIGGSFSLVPLGAATIGPDNLQVPVSSEQIKGAPSLSHAGEELAEQDEAKLYRYYKLDYTAPATASRRRLARR